MTPAAFLEALVARGVRLEVRDGRLQVDAPVGELTAGDREALGAHKPGLVALLRHEEPATFDVLGAACGLCGGPFTWVVDWPTTGEHRWLCLACAAHPVPTLGELFDLLSADERGRLEGEAAAGDDLARALLNEIAATRGRA
jgi:hypothetical protein